MNETSLSAMQLVHYTANPMEFDGDRTYQQIKPSAFGKPVGLWVSVAGEDDWHSWVTENMPGERLQHAHQVSLKPDARIHVIANPFALDAFTGTYGVKTEWEGRFAWRENDSRKWPIDWRDAARDCDGVIIAPYQWPCRMDYDWYYGWDCASGCIWNLDAVASVEPIHAEAATS